MPTAALLKVTAAQARRDALVASLDDDPTLYDLLQAVYRTAYTGRLILDCADGIPRRYEVPQPGVTGDLQHD